MEMNELKIGGKFLSSGEDNRVYTLILIDTKNNEVRLKREKDGVTLTMRLDTFKRLAHHKIMKKED